MRDRRISLARIFSYGGMLFQAAFVISSLPDFVSEEDWGGMLLMVALLAVTAFALFVWPNLLNAMSIVPYRWGVAAVLALSVLFVGVAMAKLPIIFQGLAAEPSDYVAVFGSVLFALVNIVAILITAKAGDASEAKKDIHPEA
jgi:hypothetical protein